jgi:GDP-mannose 6-dehydrogenase
VKVGVFGLGYVGTVSLGCLATLGHELIGVDVNKTKVDMIGKGESPVMEKDLDALIAEGSKRGRIKAVSRAEDSVLSTEMSLICVGTPCGPYGQMDLGYVKRVCQDIGHALSLSREFHVVVVRSTLLPGGTEDVVISALESHSGLRAGRDFGVCYNPEFLREGSAVADFYNPALTIIGEYDERAVESCAELFNGVNSSPHVVPLRAAEMIKYACNAFHALKVVFANEIGNLCKTEAIDGHQVMDVFCLDKVLNISSQYLKPGFAFGGSCLPKDLRALVGFSRRHNLKVPLLEAVLPSNRAQIQRGADIIRQTGKRRVGLLGISFKAGTDDLRESPFVELARMLLDQGYRVLIYDEDIAEQRLIGVNKAHIEKRLPRFASLLCGSAEDILESCDVIVVGKASDTFSSVVQKARRDQHIIDFGRVIKEPEKTVAQYQGICW